MKTECDFMPEPLRLDMFTPSLFWDVDPNCVDLVRHARFIIARVMDRGTRRDVDVIRQYFSVDVIRNAVLEAPDLDKKTISYFANRFGIDRMEFKAHRRKVPGTWSH
jgi:hypothetical protein